MAKQLSKITNAIENINLEKTNKESLSSSSPSSSSSSSSSFTQTSDIEQLFDNIKCSDDLFMLKNLEINNIL
ncbi:unnamed protein product, partial [Rotaria magnacalcarata]